MTKKKKLIAGAILSLVGAACLSLPGCSGGDEPSTASPPFDFPFTPPAPPPPPPPPPVPPPPPPPVTNGITLESVSTGGVAADFDSSRPSTAGDGTFLAFESRAGNLVPDKTGVELDVYLRDRTTSTTTRPSVNAAGGQADGNSGDPSVSTSGAVAFASDADDLVPNDTNLEPDIFLRAGGGTTRVSVATGGGQSNGFSSLPSTSADGSLIVFESLATNLVGGDLGGFRDVFLHNVTTGTTVLISLSSTNTPGNNTSNSGRISADGRFVAFSSVADNLVVGDTNGVRDVFLRDLQTGVTTRVSVSSAGAQGDGPSGGTLAAESNVLDISDDGRFVVFVSTATNLVPDDTNGAPDVFRHDTQTGSTVRVSVTSTGSQADGGSSQPKVSGDGRFIVFTSVATNLDARDTNGVSDVFVHDADAGTTEAVSLNTSVTTTGNGISLFPDISADGSLIVFASEATDLVVGAPAGIRSIFSAVNPLAP